MTDKKNIAEEYLDYYNTYIKKYGKEKTIVLMTVGSFYECYALEDNGPDLFEISGLLNIVCTRKDKSVNEITISNPYLLGFPCIAANKFIKILIDNGYTVITIDQISPPPKPKRAVTGIYSPGTYINGQQKPDNNFIVSIYLEDEAQQSSKYLQCAGMSAIDITTGKSYIYEIHSSNADEKIALDEISRFINNISPTEIIITYKGDDKKKEDLISYLEISNKLIHYRNNLDKKYQNIKFQNELLKKIYKDCGQISPLEYLELTRYLYVTVSFSILLDFIYDHGDKILNNIDKPEIYFQSKNVILGNNAVYQLNIVESDVYQYNAKFKSLFNVVNNTSTNMGRRLLKDRLVCPLTSHIELSNIYDYIDEIISSEITVPLENLLKNIMDIERLERKMSLNMLHPYELFEFIHSMQVLPAIINIIQSQKKLKELLFNENGIKKLYEFINYCETTFDMDELKKHNLLEITTNIFMKNKYKDIDDTCAEINTSDTFMNDLCRVLSGFITENRIINRNNNTEQPKIFIKNNDREGHYLFLSKIRAGQLKKKIMTLETIQVGNYSLDPKKLIFKELNKNGIKIAFPDLQKKSTEIDKFKEKLINLNKIHYLENIQHIYTNYNQIFKQCVSFISMLDYLKSNAKTALLYNYCRPIIDYDPKNSFIEAKQLRHPIIERIIEHEFIPYDISIGKDIKGMLIFGINCAGKTSLQKAVGLCAIMAQAGLFVPAKSCTLSPYKAIYTRITGNDNLFKGLSSFALEMLELKAILKRASQYTLVIGDEICRGTEHVSGNALVATSIINLSKLESSFIFATHLHEIAKLERVKSLKNVKAFHLSVSYDNKLDTLVYDRQLKEGSGDEIYGITVAKYIIRDADFINTALEIKNELTQDYGSLVSGKTSKYNSELFIHECNVCHKKNTKGAVSNLETHHINFQSNCENGFVKDKPYLKMNDKANLIVLCSECHDKIHNGTLHIDGQIMTSDGVKPHAKVNKQLKKN